MTPVNDDYTDADEVISVAEDSGANTVSVLTGTTSPDGPVTVTQFVIGATTYTAGDTANLTEGDLTINSDGSYSFTIADTDSVLYMYKYGLTEIIMSKYDFESQHVVTIEFMSEDSEIHEIDEKPVIYVYSDQGGFYRVSKQASENYIENFQKYFDVRRNIHARALLFLQFA